MERRQISGTLKHLTDIIDLGKPLEWGRSWFAMLFGGLMAFYMYGVQPDPVVIFIGFLSVSALWYGLYAMNDITDRDADAKSNVRKMRPLPSGRLTLTEALLLMATSVIIAFSIAVLLNNLLFLLCLAVMFANQLLYTCPPVRLKARPVLDMISGALINPFFRYLSGLVLLVAIGVFFSHPLPVLPVIIVTGLQFGSYALSRLYFKKQYREVPLQNSIAVFSSRWIRGLSYAAIVAALAATGLLFINGLTWQNPYLGFLPLQYLVALAVVLVLGLLVKEAISDPEGVDMLKKVRILYLYIVLPGILLTFAILFFFP